MAEPREVSDSVSEGTTTMEFRIRSMGIKRPAKNSIHTYPI